MIVTGFVRVVVKRTTDSVRAETRRTSEFLKVIHFCMRFFLHRCSPGRLQVDSDWLFFTTEPRSSPVRSGPVRSGRHGAVQHPGSDRRRSSWHCLPGQTHRGIWGCFESGSGPVLVPVLVRPIRSLLCVRQERRWP